MVVSVQLASEPASLGPPGSLPCRVPAHPSDTGRPGVVPHAHVCHQWQPFEDGDSVRGDGMRTPAVQAAFALRLRSKRKCSGG